VDTIAGSKQSVDLNRATWSMTLKAPIVPTGSYGPRFGAASGPRVPSWRCTTVKLRRATRFTTSKLNVVMDLSRAKYNGPDDRKSPV